MSDVLLVLNAGSSSLKYSVFALARDGDLAPAFEGQLEVSAESDHAAALASVASGIRERIAGSTLVGVGHRIVHGGTRFDQPARVDAAVMRELEALIPLAPLHQPHNLAGIRAVAARFPDLPQVACFDTAFHRSQPALAQLFAIPRELADAGVRRYGFHGLSYEYVASVLPSVAPEIASSRVVIAHLGNGASLCALRGGRSVASTMGLTALDGLVMGTRCGAIDPGVLLFLMDERGLDVRALEALLYTQSGLLGVSGVSSDMRALLASNDPHAREAIDLFVYRLGRELGSMAAALGGLDALVFTGGIGEHAATIRERVCSDAAWLGVAIDAEANERSAVRISPVGAPVSALVVPTDENRMIARHTADRLGREATARGRRS